MLGLQQEPLADEPVEPLLLAPALGPVGLAVDQADAQHCAAAVQRRIRVGRAIVEVAPTSAQRGLCRPPDYADLAEKLLLSQGGGLKMSA